MGEGNEEFVRKEVCTAVHSGEEKENINRDKLLERLSRRIDSLSLRTWLILIGIAALLGPKVLGLLVSVASAFSK